MQMKIKFSSCEVNWSDVSLFFNYNWWLENYVVEFWKNKPIDWEFLIYYKIPHSDLYINEKDELFSYNTSWFKFQKTWKYNDNLLKNRSIDPYWLYVSWYFSDNAINLLDKHWDTYVFKVQKDVDTSSFADLDIAYIHSWIFYTNKWIFNKVKSSGNDTELMLDKTSSAITSSFSIPNFWWIWIDSNNDCIIIHNDVVVKTPIKISKSERGIMSQCFTVNNWILKLSFPWSHALVISLKTGDILYNTWIDLTNWLFENVISDKIKNWDYFRSEKDLQSMKDRLDLFEKKELDYTKKYIIVIASGDDWNSAFVNNYGFWKILWMSNALYFEVNSKQEFDELMHSDNMWSIYPQLVIFAWHWSEWSYWELDYSFFSDYKFKGVWALFYACSSAVWEGSWVAKRMQSDGEWAVWLNNPNRMEYVFDANGNVVWVTSSKGALHLWKK